MPIFSVNKGETDSPGRCFYGRVRSVKIFNSENQPCEARTPHWEYYSDMYYISYIQ